MTEETRNDEAGSVAGDVTRCLRQLRGGDPSAREHLLELVYDEVRRVARAYLGRERSDHSLQATDLAHEAYLRLLGNEAPPLRDRHHFFAAYARAIRRVLVDHARRRLAAKRGGELERVSLREAAELCRPQGRETIDLLALNEVLERLSELSPRQAEIVELRYFAGRSIPETAKILGTGVTTVNREWSAARAWLTARLAS